MPFHNVFLACLFCLLLVLLCGEGDIRLFVSGLWRSVPLEGWRRGGCHLAGVLLAMLALAVMALVSSASGAYVHHPAAAACLSVAALILLGGGAVFSPFWGIPALALYGLLPAGAGCYGLMAVCLWAAGRAGAGRTLRFVALVLLLGLGHTMAAASPLGWIIGAVLLSGLCLLDGGLLGGGFGESRGDRLSLLRYCPLLRLLLLLGVMELSRQQGLTAGVQASFFALLLDMTCQCFGVFWPRGRMLALAVPPLPGFVIGWVGLHAALGLGSSTEGWTVVGGLLAVLIMALSLGEGLVILGEAPSLRGLSRKTWALGLVFACVLPPICGVLAGWFCGHGGQWSSWLYLLPGGDGSVLALPLFWLALLALWAVLGRVVPGRMRGQDGEDDAPLMQEEALSLAGEDRNGLESLRLYLNATPTRPRMMRLLAVQGHRQMRSLRLVSMEVFSLLPVREPGIVFWLVFLGGVLVILGLGQ